jgi:hypothetical protein
VLEQHRGGRFRSQGAYDFRLKWLHERELVEAGGVSAIEKKVQGRSIGQIEDAGIGGQLTPNPGVESGDLERLVSGHKGMSAPRGNEGDQSRAVRHSTSVLNRPCSEPRCVENEIHGQSHESPACGQRDGEPSSVFRRRSRARFTSGDEDEEEEGASQRVAHLEV